MVHVRTLDGKSLRFGHRGWLWHGAFILYDVGSDSLWHHQTGRALSGTLRGKALPRLPSVLVSWRDWRAAHPETRVLPKPAVPASFQDGYAPRTGLLELGLSVETEGRVRLYPFSAFGDDGLVHDTVNGRSILLARHGKTRNGSAFDRTVDDETLQFVVTRGEGGLLHLAEAGGDRRWNLVSGRPVQGSGTSRRLTPVLVTVWDTAAWSLQHPHGERYPPN